MSTDPHTDLGTTLRRHRERRGVTLSVLAESIKVKSSLLDELERNDVSRWPPGIYGRAVVREYAKAIGLPPDDTVRQFAELLSAAEERREAMAARRRENADATTDLRLNFEGVPRRAHQSIYGRLVAAGVELALVLTTGGVVAVASGLSMWTAQAIVALTWYPVRAIFGDYGLYRLLRVHQLSTSALWSHTTEIAPIATNLMSTRGTVVQPGVERTQDSFIANRDVSADPSAAAIH